MNFLNKYLPIFLIVTLLAGAGVFVYHIPTAEAGFGQYRSLTIDHTKVPNTDQTSFPVLVSGTYSYLATVGNGGKVQNANGYDVGFYTNSNCSTGKMNWETEQYTAATGQVVYWVNVSSVSHTVDTTFYMCYGDATISTDQSNKTAVWDSNFKRVYHLPDGTTLSATDSTNTGNGTITNATAAAGQIDGAGSFATNTDITASTVSLTTLTVSAWIYGSYPQNGMIVEKSNINAEWSFFFEGNYLHIRGPDAGSGDAQYAPFYTANTWHYVAATYSGTTKLLYSDGTQVATSTTGSAIPNGSGAIHIGNYDNSGYFFNGRIDEVHISNSARSADWIATEYNNQNSPSTFYTVGAETPLTSTPPPPHAQAIIDKSQIIIDKQQIIIY